MNPLFFRVFLFSWAGWCCFQEYDASAANDQQQAQQAPPLSNDEIIKKHTLDSDEEDNADEDVMDEVDNEGKWTI